MLEMREKLERSRGMFAHPHILKLIRMTFRNMMHKFRLIHACDVDRHLHCRCSQIDVYKIFQYGLPHTYTHTHLPWNAFMYLSHKNKYLPAFFSQINLERTYVCAQKYIRRVSEWQMDVEIEWSAIKTAQIFYFLTNSIWVEFLLSRLLIDWSSVS